MDDDDYDQLEGDHNEHAQPDADMEPDDETLNKVNSLRIYNAPPDSAEGLNLYKDEIKLGDTVNCQDIRIVLSTNVHGVRDCKNILFVFDPQGMCILGQEDKNMFQPTVAFFAKELFNVNSYKPFVPTPGLNFHHMLVTKESVVHMLVMLKMGVSAISFGYTTSGNPGLIISGKGKASTGEQIKFCRKLNFIHQEIFKPDINKWNYEWHLHVNSEMFSKAVKLATTNKLVSVEVLPVDNQKGEFRIAGHEKSGDVSSVIVHEIKNAVAERRSMVFLCDFINTSFAYAKKLGEVRISMVDYAKYRNSKPPVCFSWPLGHTTPASYLNVYIRQSNLEDAED